MAVYWLGNPSDVIYHSSLDWPVHKLHVALNVMFYLLYYTKSMDKKQLCLITSTNYFINQQMLNINGLKSKPFKTTISETNNIFYE